MFHFTCGIITIIIGLVSVLDIILSNNNDTPSAIIASFVVTCVLIYTGIMFCINTWNKEMNDD